MVFEGADAPSSFPRVQLMRGGASKYAYGEFKRGFTPLSKSIPPPFPREGDKGGGLLNN